ncbi:TPA: hypothetical protein QIF25_000847 [Enterobacter asburiae]|uniref:hypothetical protein n=1 Tax=Enterobacter asburiae TaxID=61645 RepID=UPI002278E7D8|nr:hypothetical protein [Enterobacter asburiae]MCY1146361.1 hypothetical protein [Enterobacter asburiae]HEO9071283.1 hypothetical protein [Enterobacter asburiae]
MSTRYNTLTVALDDDYRKEDIETLISAIGMIKGVISVTATETESSWSVEQRMKLDFMKKLHELSKSL